MFLEKSYRGNNKWYFYILTLIIVFAAVQVASIPLAIYSIIMNPEILSGGTNNILAVTNTNLSGTHAIHVRRRRHRTSVMREIFPSQETDGYTHGPKSF